MSAPPPSRDADAIDAPFAVDHVHRLRFTRSVLDPANPVLEAVLEASGDEAARVLPFLDRGVAEAWPDLPERLRAWAEAHRRRVRLAGEIVMVPGGEEAKNDRSVWEHAVAAIDGAGICRQSYVLVIGGGAVLDAVGFAAATVHRGVRLVRLPTTTLAQADGGLGVKNGINAFGKKNLLGTFAVPWAVINDLEFPGTLSARDFRAGFSEVVKVALLKDPALFEQAESGADRVAAREVAVCEALVRRSATLHLEHIVAGGDPFELTTSRPLDFGHWSAHKLEQMTGFALRHGEAVAIGVALDVLVSNGLGWLAEAEAERVLSTLERMGFALHHEALADTPSLLEGLDEFREHLGGRLTITLLRGVGEPVDVHEVDPALVETAVARLAGR